MDQLFLERMKKDLKDDYEAFIQTLEQERFQGVRYNPKKVSAKQIEEHVPVKEHSPFCEEGYYVDEPLGNHPYHLAGAFYIQEPSASSAVTILDVQPDDIVLDLCAAPGGKSTQIASKIEHGFLVTNEYDFKRAKVLMSNLERMGIRDYCLTNSDTRILCEELHDCFDKVLVDAPCSGEGMMKKHDAACENWSMDNIRLCAKRQQEILENAYKALKKEGIMVYSTCTYAKEENEEVIASFLKEHPDMIQLDPEVSFGRKGFPCPGMDASKVVRIFPMDKGEGHFICKMKKTEGSVRPLPLVKNRQCKQSTKEWLSPFLVKSPEYAQIIKDRLYVMDHPFLDLKKTRCLRQGVYAGDILKNRFEPSHALYLAFLKSNYTHTVELTREEMNAVMHGEQINKKADKGYISLCYDGLSFGYGKSDGNRITNKIPKGLRLLPNSQVKGELK